MMEILKNILIPVYCIRIWLIFSTLQEFWFFLLLFLNNEALIVIWTSWIQTPFLFGKYPKISGIKGLPQQKLRRRS